MSKKKRVVIVVVGQPSSNPRTVKEYLTLKEAGYDVKVLYGFWTTWAAQMDEELFSKGILDRNDFVLVAGSPFREKWLYFFSRFLYKFFRSFSIRIGRASTKDWSLNRPSFFLFLAAKKMTADLYVAHNLGALPAAMKAARKAKVPCSFDAEDFHRGDLGDGMSYLYGLVTALEEEYMPHCAYITAAAPLIASAYEQALGMTNIRVINNVFSRKYIQPVSTRNNETLRLFWFSQSIGPERGLELIVSALSLLPACRIELHLLGLSTEGYREELREKALRSEDIHFLDPVAPQDIFPLAAGFDIGMASEVPHCENRDICLTNKLFTYLLAGNCILASNTSAQKKFLTDYPGIGSVYDHSTAADLAEKLSFFFYNRQALLESRQRASRLAAASLSWEKESRLLLDLVASAIRPS